MAKKVFSKLFRERFVNAWYSSREEVTFEWHCERFGVSRQAGYEWLDKFESGGASALATQSSAPHSSPHQTDETMVARILLARRQHPTWGPRKLKRWLQRQFPWAADLPANSTMGDIIKRAGLVAPPPRKHALVRYAAPFKHVLAPNDVWTTDFKGHFRTNDGLRCYPLTLADAFSRFLLRCDAYVSPSGEIRRSFERAFKDHGLPWVIRNDNGLPFAYPGSPAGLSSLSVWWVRLGILPERTAPAAPWENGRHERMHRTLKAEATMPPQASSKQQQRAFDSFRREYNHERPHDALQLETPASVYTNSKRQYPRRLPELEYPKAYQLRIVNDSGSIGWEGKRLFVSNLLRGEVLGLKQVDDGVWDLHFGRVRLGSVDRRKAKLVVAKGRRSAKPRRG